MSEIMDTDFIETFGLFSVNPTQITDIKYYQNALYFYFNKADKPSLRIKFNNEKDARNSLDGFKKAVTKKSLDDLEVGE